VRVLALSALRGFWQSQDAKAEAPMRLWFRESEMATSRNFSDVRATFGQSDIVRARYIFDVGGNKWRIIARINFEHQRVLIRWVGAHNAYSRLTDEDVARL